MFVRNGLYKEGKFKFRADFKAFPEHPPQICFVSEVYHPLVNAETGELDLNVPPEPLRRCWTASGATARRTCCSRSSRS